MINRRRALLSALVFAAAVPAPVAAAACRVTERNSLGPYYRREAPFTSTLAGPSEPGEPLVVTGRVLAADGCTPLDGAVVDAWHANAQGRYYNVGGSRDDGPGQFRLRGRVKTNERGEYRFETIMPGSYSMGSATRPRHVHFVVSHPGSRELVTQMYFSGDPNLEHDWLVKESLIVDRVGDTAKFDIVLRPG